MRFHALCLSVGKNYLPRYCVIKHKCLWDFHLGETLLNVTWGFGKFLSYFNKIEFKERGDNLVMLQSLEVEESIPLLPWGFASYDVQYM